MVDYYFKKTGSSYYGYNKEYAIEQYIVNDVNRYYSFNKYPLPLDEHYSPDNPYLGKVGYHVQFPDWVQKAAENYGSTHKVYKLKKPYDKDEYMLEPVSYGSGYSDPYYCMETALEHGLIAIVKGNNAEALYFYMGKYFMSEDELMQDVKDNPDLYAICTEIEHASVDVVIDAIKRWHVREWGDEGAPIVDYEQIGLLFSGFDEPDTGAHSFQWIADLVRKEVRLYIDDDVVHDPFFPFDRRRFNDFESMARWIDNFTFDDYYAEAVASYRAEAAASYRNEMEI